MDVILSVIGSLFGILITTLLGMAMNKLSEIGKDVVTLNTQLFTHVTASHVHEAGFARLEEQVKNLLQVVTVAHDRVDRIETRLEASHHDRA